MSGAVIAVLIGAGDRGFAAYAPYALSHPEELRFVAVAEPVDSRRERFAIAHHIPHENQHRSWEDLLDRGQLADTAVVTTMDHLHFAPTLAALEAGYHVLLEKPMATTIQDCAALVHASEKAGKLLQICHELRYTSFFTSMQKAVASNVLGDIVSVQYSENQVHWANVHSFVRGHWRNSLLECPKILAKGCHDLDLIYWMFGKAQNIHSFGSLSHFRPENAPPGAPERCTDGCPAAETCLYYAPRMYLELEPLVISALVSSRWWERLGAGLLLGHPQMMNFLRQLFPQLNSAFDYRGWPISVISEDTSFEARQQALRYGPWGRCVYHCDNDVVDHQTVSMEMENGATIVYMMNGHSHDESRTIRIDGTSATLMARFTDGLGDDYLHIHNHLSGRKQIVAVEKSRHPHGGGDEAVVAAFVRAVGGQAESITSARESMESHLMAFAAEKSRHENRVIEMAAFRAELHER